MPEEEWYGSRLVILDNRNHLPTGDDAAWPMFVSELEAFLSEVAER